MMELTLGAWVSQAIQAAAELGIADALAGGPLPLDELASRVGTDADALRRLMRALISRGIFRQNRDGRYDLTPLADTLRSDAPASTAGGGPLLRVTETPGASDLLVESVRTGKSIIPLLHGKEFFDYLDADPEFAKLFNDAMTSVSELTEAPIVAGYDFSAYPTIVDVGGGHGSLLAAILAATPTAQGVLYDLPEVVAGAPTLPRRRGVEDRVRIEGGSFFDSAPAGEDAYILKMVVHDWPDEKAVEILRSVRAAAMCQRGGVTDRTRDYPNTTATSSVSGRIWRCSCSVAAANAPRRSTATCYGQAGSRMTRVAQTASPFSVVEARPA